MPKYTITIKDNNSQAERILEGDFYIVSTAVKDKKRDVITGPSAIKGNYNDLTRMHMANGHHLHVLFSRTKGTSQEETHESASN